LRKLFLLLDIVRFKVLMRKLVQEKYDYILSDRYFYDSVINVLYLSKNTTTLLCEQYIPKPDVAFYFHITAEEILKRDRVPEQGIEYLSDKIAIFEQKKRVFGLISIDASQDKTTILSSLKKSIIS